MNSLAFERSDRFLCFALRLKSDTGASLLLMRCRTRLCFPCGLRATDFLPSRSCVTARAATNGPSAFFFFFSDGHEVSLSCFGREIVGVLGSAIPVPPFFFFFSGSPQRLWISGCSSKSRTCFLFFPCVHAGTLLLSFLPAELLS